MHRTNTVRDVRSAPPPLGYLITLAFNSSSGVNQAHQRAQKFICGAWDEDRAQITTKKMPFSTMASCEFFFKWKYIYYILGKFQAGGVEIDLKSRSTPSWKIIETVIES
jgi:hypothetical protein